MLVYYEDQTGAKWLIDPSFEELNNLSNNLVLVTVLKGEQGDRMLIEKAID
jgi:hypothetical protein